MKKRGVALVMAAVVAAMGISGCGGKAKKDSETGKAEKIRLMVWSPSEDQSKDSGEWLQTTCEDFAKLHTEWDITFVTELQMRRQQQLRWHRIRRQVQMYLCMRTIH